MNEKFDSLIKKDTEQLTMLLPDLHALSRKWVHKTKPINDAISIVRNWLKARLVASGFEQQYDIDYNETFALVACWFTL